MYNTAVEEGKESQYFVNYKAYGTPQGKRSTDLVSSLWTASEVWEETLEELMDSGKCNFIKFWKFMKGDTGTKFSNVGPLTAYLLVADYVEAGLVQEPTLDELAQLILELNRGALQGLRALGLLPLGKHHKVTPSDVLLAVKKIWAYLEETLSGEVKEKIQLSPILLEHALCKYSRLGIQANTVIG